MYVEQIKDALRLQAVSNSYQGVIAKILLSGRTSQDLKQIKLNQTSPATRSAHIYLFNMSSVAGKSDETPLIIAFGITKSR